MLLQFLVNGFITGSVYALVALGFSLIYNTTRIFHIAYAVLFMIAPYVFYTLYVQNGCSYVLSVLTAIVTVIILSVLIEISIYQPLIRRKSSLNVIMISSIGFMIIAINIIALIFGNEMKQINPGLSHTIQINEIIITKSQLIQLIVSISLLSLFMIFLKFSGFGIKTRALRDDDNLCLLFGMNISRFRLLLFALSGLFVAIGGLLVSYDVGMNPYIGMPMFLNAVVALIIGGIGKFHAPIIGGFVIGLLQALVVWQFSSNWQDALTFGLLIIFLVFRPQGLFGEKQRFV